MTTLALTKDDLAAAAVGLEFERDRIEAKIAEIRQLLDGRTVAAAATKTEKPHKKRSAAVRRKMALAQRARWAKIKQIAEPQQTETAKPKRRLSAAGRKRIAEAARKRWAAIRKAAESQPAVAK